MGGLGPISLPPLPSPAAGIAAPNVFAQLAQAVGQFPQQQRDAQESRLKLETQQRKVAQDQYDRITQMVKGNRALASSPVIVKQLKDLSKVLGIPAPVVSGADASAASAPSAGGQGAPATAAGASAPPQQPAASAAPGAPGAWHPPMAAPSSSTPAAPSAAPAQLGAPAPAAPPAGEMVDVRALFPRQTYQEFAVDPRNVAEAMKLSPEQRRAAYPFEDAPEAFYTAPKVWDAGDTQKMIYARTMMADAMKSGDRKSVIAAVRAVLPMFSNDPNFDPSSLIDPSAFADVGKNEARKLNILEKAQVIRAGEARERWRKTEAEIKMMGTREGLMRSMQDLNVERKSILGPESRARIEAIHTRAMDASTRLHDSEARLRETISYHRVQTLGKDRGEVARYRSSLVTELNGLRNEARSALQAGDTDTATAIATQITQLQGQIDAADHAIADSHSPSVIQGAIKQAIAGADRVKPKGGAPTPDAGTQPMSYKGRTIVQSGGRWVYQDDGSPAQ